MIELKDKLYTSTEVADIIGVSLRSVYRYLEEGKLNAEVKTATGRHRFTKKNILDFLYPDREEEIDEMVSEEVKVQKESKVEEVVQEPEQKSQEVKEEAPKEEVKEEKEEPKKEKEPEKEEEKTSSAEAADSKEEDKEEVDWLAKFREAAKKYNDEPEEETTLAEEEKTPKEEGPQVYYYRSKLGGLKEIAQNIDKTAKNSDVEYAFTMHAGLSLFKPIKPFSTLHAYIKPKDRSFYEKVLMLTPAEEDNAQLALITWPQEKLFNEKQELHGLNVVSNKRLLSDIAENDEELHKDALEILK